MIGKLTGKIDSVSGNQLIVDVNGVGYVVTVSARTLRQLGIGTTASLLVETQVREDAISLFGFADHAERDWFRLLTTVQGVGAKVALAILGALSPDQLGQAISAQDKAAITQADGVGPKLGLRIVTELKDKVLSFFVPSPTATTAPTAPSSTSGEALSALMNLGYRRIEAFAAVTAASQKLGSAASLNDLIKGSLAELATGGKE
jgi:Holliday junction DNA helicase RuvA